MTRHANDYQALQAELAEKTEIINRLMAAEKELTSLTLELLAKNEELKARITTDDLTGLNNRHYFDRRAGEEIERADRYGSPLSLVIIDLDHFKSINDRWGHDIGDKALRHVTDIIRSNIRKPDILARWGGEEFVLLAPQTDLAGSAALAEKLRKAINASAHPIIGKLTSSFGVAEWIKGEPYENWFRRADQSLYQAKSKGRDCVVCSSGGAGLPLPPVRLDWKAVWDCGYQQIDRQHRELVGLVNSLLDETAHAGSPGQTSFVFNQLIEGFVHHFTEEEKVLCKINYPDLACHGERHQSLIKKMLRQSNILRQIDLSPANLFTFLVDEIVVGHILTEDVLFYPYFRREAEATA